MRTEQEHETKLRQGHSTIGRASMASEIRCAIYAGMAKCEDERTILRGLLELLDEVPGIDDVSI